MDHIAKKIAAESKQFSRNSNEYNTRITISIALQSVSPTLLAFLRKISNNLDNIASSSLIAKFITNVVVNQPTSLQIDLSVLLSWKTLIETLYEYRVCCSFDEYLHLKASAVSAAEMQTDLRGLVNTNKGLVHVVCKIFLT